MRVVRASLNNRSGSPARAILYDWRVFLAHWMCPVNPKKQVCGASRNMATRFTLAIYNHTTSTAFCRVTSIEREVLQPTLTGFTVLLLGSDADGLASTCQRVTASTVGRFARSVWKRPPASAMLNGFAFKSRREPLASTRSGVGLNAQTTFCWIVERCGTMPPVSLTSCEVSWYCTLHLNPSLNVS